MNILFLHRNFPAQFRHLAAHFARNPENKVVFITGREDGGIPGIYKAIYKLKREPNPNIHHYLKFFEESILHGQAAASAAIGLKSQGFIPDVIYGHSWGPTLYMKDIFPDSPMLGYFEWYYRDHDSDVDFEVDGNVPVDTKLCVRTKSSPMLMDLISCDKGIVPTYWQLSQFPEDLQDKLTVLHDGIDPNYFVPKPGTKVVLPHLNLDLSHVNELVTYVTRGMEPYRGFPQFMEAISILLEKRPNCHVIIVGEDRVCYGRMLSGGKTYKQEMLEKLSLDLSRVHFTGYLSYEQYLTVLQASSVHIYLTYPFVLSWSMIESMSAGCIVLGSSTPPVKEIIQDGVNGFLADFHSPQEFAEKAYEILDNQEKLQHIRYAARETVIKNYALQNLLPKQVQIITDLAKTKQLITV